MILVSEPERRLLVSSTSQDNHETTLVVPELGQAKIEYFKCLVDGGLSFEEHAVVIAGDEALSLIDRGLVVRALTGARPTVVSFVAGGKFLSSNWEKVEGSGAAACAVCSRPDADAKEQECGGFSVRRQGRFYSCELLADSEH